MVATRNSRKRKREDDIEDNGSQEKYVQKGVAKTFPLAESSRSKRKIQVSRKDFESTPSKKGKEKEVSEKPVENDDAMILENDIEDDDDEEEEEFDWETVELPQTTTNEQDQETQVYKDVEITFEAPRAVLKKSRWEVEYQRNLREWIHNVHVLALVSHYTIRNRWCLSEKARSQCLKIIPKDIKNHNPSEPMIRLKSLLKWWQEYFTITGLGLQTHPYSDFGNIEFSVLQKMMAESSDRIDSLDDFLKLLLTKEGTSDVYSELFVAILRACGYDTRLVCSLQPLPYKIPSGKKSEKDEPKESQDEKSDLLFQFRTPTKTHVDQNLQLKQKNAKPPTVWAEVYCHKSKRWICVDPLREIVDKPALMEPAALNRGNQLSFVLALDEKRKRCMTDVTRRYTSNMDRAIRLRGRPITKREQAAGMKPWSEVFMEIVCYKPKIGEREELELQDLDRQETKEKMPTSIGAFKNNSSYVLERHLKKFEILYPKEPILGSIKGEKIYPRQCVKVVSTADVYRKQGREIIKGEQPVKMVKTAAITIEKKRMNEMAKQDGQEAMTPCYGEWQTQKIIPDPIIDGKVTKNSYGNIDLFTPEMLPAGGVHIPIKGIGKVAKKLGVDYADAVTGFEFVKMRSVPIIEGIVIAKEFQYVIMEALEEQEQNEAIKAIEKQEKEVYLRWRKLIKSLLIKARVDNEYGKEKESKDNEDMWATFNKDADAGGGGFLPEGDL
ncbi:unnamed protein product [Rhizopus stolonifer]